MMYLVTCSWLQYRFYFLELLKQTSEAIYTRKHLIGFTLSEGESHWWQSKGKAAGTVASSYLAPQVEGRTRAQWEWNKSFQTSKPTPSNIPSPTILHLLILPKQSQPTVDQVFKHMSHWIHLHPNYQTLHSSNIYAPEPVSLPSQDSHYYSS